MINAKYENEIATEQSYTQIEMYEVLNTLNQFFPIKIILSKKGYESNFNDLLECKEKNNC